MKSPGNPKLRVLGDHQRAVAEAVEPADLVAVLRRLVEAALDGDVAAAKTLLDRVLGRVREQPTARVELPELDSAAAVAEGLRRVAVAAAAGELSTTEAVSLGALLERVGEATALAELEQRVGELERQR